MSIWGKLVGAGTGMLFGGPLGALIGGVMGHFYDRKAEAQDQDPDRLEDGATRPGGDGGAFGAFGRMREQARQAAFSAAVVVLGAKMAKADGVVTREEVAAFKRIFNIPPQDVGKVAKIFDKAKQSSEGFEIYARQVAVLFRDSPQVLEELLDALFMLATADGGLHPAEAEFLRKVAEIFGMPERDFDRVRAGHRSGARGTGGDPHAVLGVSRDASDEEVRAAYKKLIREHHPDALMARGMPAEFVEVANRKMAVINAAWDDIARRRGLK